jgi:hypothetical protein
VHPIIFESQVLAASAFAEPFEASPVEVPLKPYQHIMREPIIQSLLAFHGDSVRAVWPSHLRPPSHIQPHLPPTSLVILEMPRLGAFCRWFVVDADIAGTTEGPGLTSMRSAPRPLSALMPFCQTRS